MELSDFYAITTNRAPLSEGDETSREINLTSHLVGTLKLPERILGVSDAFSFSEPVEFEVPKDTGAVWVTIADVSEEQDGSHLRTAYFSILFSSESPAAIASAVEIRGATDFGVPVDTGTFGFYSPKQLQKLVLLADEEIEEILEIISDETDTEEFQEKKSLFYSYGFSNENFQLALASSGWGDGSYPVLQTLDANGNILGLHVDFYVVGEEPDEDEIAEENKELETLKKQEEDYANYWPTFLPIGIAFIVLGMQQTTFLIVGIMFLCLSFYWATQAQKFKKQRESLSSTQTEEKTNPEN